MTKNKKKLSVQEAGRRGGERTLERHGVEHFRKLGKIPKKKRREKEDV